MLFCCPLSNFTNPDYPGPLILMSRIYVMLKGQVSQNFFASFFSINNLLWLLKFRAEGKLITLNHRVDRVLSFFSSRRYWDSPPPARRRVCPPPPHPLVQEGRAHSLAEEGLWESQFRRGDIHCGILYIYSKYWIMFWPRKNLVTRFLYLNRNEVVGTVMQLLGLLDSKAFRSGVLWLLSYATSSRPAGRLISLQILGRLLTDGPVLTPQQEQVGPKRCQWSVLPAVFPGSVLILYGSGSSILDVNIDPYPGFWWPKILKIYSWKKSYIFFISNYNLLYP